MAAQESDEELDRRFNIARDELDRLMALPRHKKQVDDIKGRSDYDERLVWLASDPDTCEQLNSWLKNGELEREVRREVVKKRNADLEAQADAEVEVRAEVESDGGLADRIERAVSLGQEWVLGKAPQSLW